MRRVDPDPVTVKERRAPHDGSREAASESRTINLGRGRVVPYPEPTSEAATRIGKANRRTGTKPEVRLRSALHRRGHRFRKDHLLRAGAVRVRPDVVFTRKKVVVFVDGCFWHGCPKHQNVPTTNRDYWVPKLAANVERDRRVDAALSNDGWVVVRIWEHLDLDEAVDLVEHTVRAWRAHPDRRARGAT
jgi:DNA mismatch endonuclease (patch repair protein)